MIILYGTRVRVCLTNNPVAVHHAYTCVYKQTHTSKKSTTLFSPYHSTVHRLVELRCSCHLYYVTFDYQIRVGFVGVRLLSTPYSRGWQ